MSKEIIIKAKLVQDPNNKAEIEKITSDLEKNPVEVPVKVTTEGSIAELKKLKAELRNAAAGSDEFKKLYNQIDDLEEKIKGSKKASSDWVDTLANAGGPLGAVGKGINAAKESVTSFGGALKATGIGLIVGALGLLVGAFKDNEIAMKKIQPLLDGFQRIFQGVFRAVEPLFNMLVDLALKALPYVTDAIATASAVVISFVKSLGSIGSAIGKLLTGDFKGAWDSAKEAVTSFGANYTKTKDAFNAGTKEMTETEKEEAEKRKKLLEEQEKKRKELADKRKAEEEKAAAERKKAREEELKDLQDFNSKVFAAQNEQMDKEIEAQKEAQKVLDSLKPAETPAQKLEREYLEKKAILERANQSTFELEVKYLSDKEQLETDAAEKTKKTQLDAAQKIADEEKKLQQEKIQSVNQTLDAVINLAGQETAVGKAALVAKQAIAAAELGLSIKSMLVASTETTTKATLKGAEAGVDIAAGAGKTAAAAPFPANIPLILGYAAQAIGIVASVKSALSKAKASTSGIGGASLPTTTPSITQTTPNLSVIGQTNAINTTQTATQTVEGSQTPTMIVKAYVSETEITETQNKINKIQSNSQLGG